MSVAPIYRARDWPHGLRCAKCGGGFVEGDPYSEMLDGFQGGVPVVVIWCRVCAVEVTG